MSPFPASHFLAFVALASSVLAHCSGLSSSSSFYTSISIITTIIHITTALADTLSSSPSSSNSLPRLGLYYQNFHDSAGNPVSLLPLITKKGIAMTHIFLAAFHVSPNASTFHLNDLPPSDPSYDTLWSEVKKLQKYNVRVQGMVGGAASGSFKSTTLDASDDATFEAAYAQLHTLAKTYHLDGFNLDVEQPMSQSGIERLVKRLKTDFGSDFEVTLSPVAAALVDGPTEGPVENLSGFSYNKLETDVGHSVAFYTAQFFNGWGDISAPKQFEAAVTYGFAPDKVCVSLLTNNENGHGYVDIKTVGQSMATLASMYGTLCGIAGWEYFNALPGNESAPWEWAQKMTSILRPGRAAKIRLTRREAEDLTRAWERSKIAPGEDGIRRRGHPSALDYFALVPEGGT